MVLIRCFLLFCLISFVYPLTYAQSRLDSLEKELPNLSGKPRVDVLNDLGFNYAFSSLKKAKKYAFMGLEESKKLGVKKAEIRALINVGYSYYDYKKNDSAEYYFTMAAALSDSTNNKEGLANANNALGNVMNRRSKYTRAITFYKNSLNAQEELENLSGQASALNNIGNALRQVGNFDEAIKYFVRALEINEKENDISRVILNLNNIAWVYIDQQNNTEAEKYLNKMVALESQMNMRNKVNLYNWLGAVASAKKEYEQANAHFDLAEDYADSLGIDKYTILHNRADLYLNQGKLNEALNLANEILRSKKATSSAESILFTLDLIADIHLQAKNYDKAILSAQEALEISSEIKARDKQMEIFKVLARANAGLGNYQVAWKYDQAHDQLKDSLYNINKTEQQEALLALYEAEQKQKTIEVQEANLQAQKATLALSSLRNNQLTIGVAGAAILALAFVVGFINQRKTNKQLNEQKQVIEARDKEKAVLLKEIHHRVKNNLQVISSILNIQSRHLEDDTAKQAVSEGRSRIKSMSLIHEKLYSNDQLSIINMKDYIEELTTYLFSSYKPSHVVSKYIDSDDVELDIDTAIPLGLILNELISNSLKYAFKDTDGLLEVRLKKFEGEYQLSVKDTGQGFTIDFEKVKSMGWRLVNTLSKQLDAALEIKNEGGANISLKFKPKTPPSLA